MTCLRRAAVVALCSLFSHALFAATATVDCTGATPGAHSSIGAALATLDEDGPHLISVSGTCTEQVEVAFRDRLTLEGSPTARLEAPGGAVLSLSRARGFTLRNVTVAGGGQALWVGAQSDATLQGVVLEDSGIGLVVGEDSSAVLGGAGAGQAVAIRGNGVGALIDSANLTFRGHVAVEENGTGIDAERSRVAILGAPAAPNAVRDNTGNGIFAHGGTDLDLRGANEVSNNGLSGILAFEGSVVDVIGAGAQTTTFAGNGRSAVALIFNSSGRVTNAVVTGNGSADQPFSAGISANNNSSAIISGTTISITVGPGIDVQAGGMARISGTTVTGGTGAPVLVRTGGIVELLAGNGIASVSCDATSVLFGSGSSVPTDCKKVK